MTKSELFEALAPFKDDAEIRLAPITQATSPFSPTIVGVSHHTLAVYLVVEGAISKQPICVPVTYCSSAEDCLVCKEHGR